MTFSPHKGMDLAKICISKMVYSNRSYKTSPLAPTHWDGVVVGRGGVRRFVGRGGVGVPPP